MTNIQARQLAELIVAYWTPERIELWHQYKKTDCSISWRDYELMNRKEKST